MDYELQFTSNRIVENEGLFDLIENNTITEILDLENSKSLITIVDENKLDESNHDTSSVNISIGIASAVTSYAIIFMSEIKMKYKEQLYYSDTDSAFLDCEIDPEYIGTGLGKWKLEYDFKEVVFLGPKVYGGILKNKKEIVKVKGFKNLIKFKELKSLLMKDSFLKLNHKNDLEIYLWVKLILKIKFIN